MPPALLVGPLQLCAKMHIYSTHSDQAIKTLSEVQDIPPVWATFLIPLTSHLQIECCIDEQISSIRSNVPFTTALYKHVYEDHIHCLEHFDKVTKQIILPNILIKLYNRGQCVLENMCYYIS